MFFVPLRRFQGNQVSASVSLLPVELLLVELVFSPALIWLRLGWASATSARSGRVKRSFSNHFADIFGRARRVMRQTASNRAVVEKFCVTAMVWSRFNTACHHPSGTNIISPGYCTTSMGSGNPCLRHSSVVVRGYILLNHVMDSPSSPRPLGFIVGLSTDRGGYSAQRFLPDINAFHALVAKGSTWTELPLLGGPNTIHLYGGRLFSPTCLKRS